MLAPAAPARAATSPLANPRTNIAPSPNFFSAGHCTATTSRHGSCANPCVGSRLVFPRVNDTNQTCTAFLARALARASVLDGAAPLTLPSNWAQLTVAEQLFVLADLERVDRGLPPYLGLTASLDAAAQRAARRGTDPSGTGTYHAATWGGAWASGYSPLVADYLWIYDDGWGGSTGATTNLACHAPGAPGCWRHRDALLGDEPARDGGVGAYCTDCEMGAAYAPRGAHTAGASYVDLVARPAGRPTPVVFSWRTELAYFTSGGPALAPASHGAGGIHP